MLERRAAVEPVQEPPGLEKGFLRQVLDLLEIAFITVQDGEHPRLMPPDQFGEFIGLAAADPGQQFSIVIHRVRFMAEPGPQVEIKFNIRLFAEPCVQPVDRLVNDTVQVGLQRRKFRPLLIGQDRADLVENFHAFDRDIRFHNGDLGRRSTH